MQRFKNILLVLNESHLTGPATQRAFNLAKSNNAKDASIWVEEQKKSIEKAQRALRDRYNSFILNQGMKNLNLSFHSIEGEAENVIIDNVSREEIDFVVMGSVARTDLVGFLVGNTSEAVFKQINSSVLAIKPPGFISPVNLADR